MARTRSDRRRRPARGRASDALPRPPFRRLRVYAFDPSLETQLEKAVINQIVVKAPWEEGLKPGPIGEYLEVVDYDPASAVFYPPIDLNEPALLAQDGLAPSEGTPQFHQQMVYAVAMTTIRNFERALGRAALWAPHFDKKTGWKAEYVQRLRIYPHALRQANAYYSPTKKALLFGYFPADASDPGGHMPGGMVFTCLSHDVIVHETAHALLDGLHRRFIEPSNPDSLAFHEGFADIVALLQHFSFPDVLKHQIGKTRGDLTRQNLLGELAQQFGEATGRRGALRSAIGHKVKRGDQDVWEPQEPVAGAYRATTEPHDRGSHLVAAVFDAFLSIYKTRIADLLRISTGGTGELPTGQLHPDLVNRLAGEAAKTAGHVLTMCLRALDYLPPVDLTFGEYLRALITADYELVPDDTRNYRVAVIEAFRRRGIYPEDLRTLSVESLRWNVPTSDQARLLRAVLPPPGQFQQLSPRWDIGTPRRAIFFELQKFQAKLERQLKEGFYRRPKAAKVLGLDLTLDRGKFEVHSLRPARRIGPDGNQVVELVAEITQRQPVFFKDGQWKEERIWNRRDPREDADFWFRGGCTLLINPKDASVRYAVLKRIDNLPRLEEQKKYMSRMRGTLRAAYFGPLRRLEETEAFAMLHRGQAQEVVDD